MKKLNSLLLLISLFSLNLAFAQVPNYVPTTGLVAFYNLDGNGNDASGSNNNLTNFSAVPTTDRHGNANAAYSFNGSSHYLINNIPSFAFGQNGAFTVSMWMFKSATASGVAIMYGSTAAGNFIWNMQNGATATQFGCNKQQSTWFWAAGTYTTGTWIHYVGVFDNGSMTLYKNGVVDGTNTYTHTGALATNLPLYVGRGVSGSYFTGSLDEIGIWNRALTVAEIGLLYAGCGSLLFTQPTNQTQNILSSALFNINAVSNSTFQWQMNDGATWTDLSNSGQYSGVTTSQLNISNLTLANSGSEFRCLITNGACLDTTDVATLTVQCTNLVGADPSSVVAYTNSTAQMVVSATNAGAAFQWQKQITGTWTDLSNGGQYSGVTTNTLSIANLTLANNGESYRCVLAQAGCSDTSLAAPLTVLSNIGIEEDNIQALSIYPNPAKDYFTVKVDPSLVNNVLIIRDMTGKTVMEVTITSIEQSINISGLTKGQYIATIDGNSSVQMKLIVQ